MSDNLEEDGDGVNNLNSLISNVGHPLLNPVVASKLFELVNLSQLRTLRLVCKDWHSTSIPLWRRTVQINIHEESSNDQLLQWKSLGNDLDFAEEQPFQNFRLHMPQFLTDISRPYDRFYWWNDHPDFEGAYRNMERFWANYGHWIHKLELQDVFVTNVEAFKRAIFEQTPNLQKLTIDGCGGRFGSSNSSAVQAQADEDEGHAQPNLNLKAFVMKDRIPELPFGWGQLFTRFPNIQRLEISQPKKSDEFFEALESMLRNGVRRPNLLLTDLRVLHFRLLNGTSLVTDLSGLLRNSMVRLKVLHLSFHQYVFDCFDLDVLEAAMQLHGNTLNELHLENNGIIAVDFLSSSHVASFASVTELQMKGYTLAFNLHFLLKFPNLKVLRLEQRLCHDKMWKGTNWTCLGKMPHLREFYFMVTDEGGFLSPKGVERFAEITPNLECFTGQLTNWTLRVVCRNWRNLKKLVILSGMPLDEEEPTTFMDIDDVGITGIVPWSDRRVPCVADLQELRHLTLQHVTLIGDASVFDGFLKLPHLSTLDICETNKISEGLGALEERLQGGLTFTPLCE